MSPQVNNPSEIEAPYLFQGTALENQKSPILTFLQIISEVGLFSELPEHELEELSKASGQYNSNQKNQPALPIGGDNVLALATELQAILQIKSIKKVAKEADQEAQVNNDIVLAMKKIANSPLFKKYPELASVLILGVMQMESTMKAQYKSEKKDTKSEILRLEAIINALIEHDKKHKHPSKNGHDTHGTSDHK